MKRQYWTGLAVLSLVPLVTAAAGSDQPPPSEDLRSELKAYAHKVIFETNRDGNWELYMVNADGSSPVNLTQTPGVDEVYPKPSPDGTRIAYVADQGKGERRVRNVYLMNGDGSDRVKIAENAARAVLVAGRDIDRLPQGRVRQIQPPGLRHARHLHLRPCVGPDSPASQRQDRAPLHAQLAGRRQVVRRDRPWRDGLRPRDRRDRGRGRTRRRPEARRLPPERAPRRQEDHLGPR